MKGSSDGKKLKFSEFVYFMKYAKEVDLAKVTFSLE
jgi:hypothetical protein